jgi:hypothetical protein
MFKPGPTGHTWAFFLALAALAQVELTSRRCRTVRVSTADERRWPVCCGMNWLM